MKMLLILALIATPPMMQLEMAMRRAVEAWRVHGGQMIEHVDREYKEVLSVEMYWDWRRLIEGESKYLKSV